MRTACRTHIIGNDRSESLDHFPDIFLRLLSDELSHAAKRFFPHSAVRVPQAKEHFIQCQARSSDNLPLVTVCQRSIQLLLARKRDRCSASARARDSVRSALTPRLEGGVCRIISLLLALA